MLAGSVFLALEARTFRDADAARSATTPRGEGISRQGIVGARSARRGAVLEVRGTVGRRAKLADLDWCDRLSCRRVRSWDIF
jgi:hypothetical protein